MNEKWKLSNYSANSFLQFNYSNVGPLCVSQTLLKVNYFKKYTSRIFATYPLAHMPQKVTNYLSEIKVADPIFGKFSMNLFLVIVKF